MVGFRELLTRSATGAGDPELVMRMVATVANAVIHRAGRRVWAQMLGGTYATCTVLPSAPLCEKFAHLRYEIDGDFHGGMSRRFVRRFVLRDGFFLGRVLRPNPAESSVASFLPPASSP